jgi:1-deoxy-D-xylulose-5-phosphate synthase
MDDSFKVIPIGTSEVLKEGNDVAIIAVGASVPYAIKAAGELALKGIEATVINGRFVKPLDSEVIVDTARRIKYLVTVEENVLSGGFGSNVLSLLQDAGLTDVKVKMIGIPDKFVEHGTPSLLREKYGLDSDGIIRETIALLPQVKRIHC